MVRIRSSIADVRAVVREALVHSASDPSLSLAGDASPIAVPSLGQQ